jgi:uncharacterized protein (DUF111 family)
MLLAAMIELSGEPESEGIKSRMAVASDRYGLRFCATPMEEDEDRGLALSYISKAASGPGTTSYEEAHSRLSDIGSVLGPGVDIGRRILDRIFEAEAAAHRTPKTEVHLHEIGRPQALLNIAGIGHVAHLLSARGETFACTSITTGKGTVVTAHGPVRIPAPATAHLLRGLDHLEGESPGERATPTGVGAVSVLCSGQTDYIPGAYARKGVGFGTKRFAGRLGRVKMGMV